MFGRTWLICGVGQNPAKISRTRPIWGRAWPKSGQFWAKSGTKLAEPGANWPIFESGMLIDQRSEHAYMRDCTRAACVWVCACVADAARATPRSAWPSEHVTPPPRSESFRTKFLTVGIARLRYARPRKRAPRPPLPSPVPGGCGFKHDLLQPPARSPLRRARRGASC